MTITDHHLEAAEWQSRLAAAEAMIPLVGELYRRRGVVTSLHGTSLVNRSTIEIIKAHGSRGISTISSCSCPRRCH